jgi:phosphopantothenoylcysteine decarboxylase/phosphopantothenate--cysteine ligase
MKKQTVVLGISGGIAAFKVIDLIKIFLKKNINLEVILTSAGAQLLDVKYLEKTLGKKTHQHLFPHGFDLHKILQKRQVEHIDLADQADLIVLVPATANLIAKLANGLADDFLTTTVLASRAPVVICPTMNVNMWTNPVVQQNLIKIGKLNYQVINPVAGPLACGYDGLGRLPEIKDLAAEILARLKQSQSLKGKRVLVTSGATQESLDKVRFLTNHSSGKMGVALAEACHLRGAKVTLIRGVNSAVSRLPLNSQVFTTSRDLEKLLKKEAKKQQIIFQVAAVGDFVPISPFSGKLDSQQEIILRLKPQLKIINKIKNWAPQVQLIGFKATYGNKNLDKVAKQKLTDTQAEALIVNDVSKTDIGFNSEDNQVTIYLKNGQKFEINKNPKPVIAAKIVDYLTDRLDW